MDKELKNRSGSISNRGGQNENKGNSKKTSQVRSKKAIDKPKMRRQEALEGMQARKKGPIMCSTKTEKGTF